MQKVTRSSDANCRDVATAQHIAVSRAVAASPHIALQAGAFLHAIAPGSETMCNVVAKRSRPAISEGIGVL